MLLLRVLMLFGLCWELSSSTDCIVDCWTTTECGFYEGGAWLVEHTDLTLTENVATARKLVFAHNGLRNRVAHKLGICDMLAIRWNDMLANAANYYHKRRLRTVNCTTRLTMKSITMLTQEISMNSDKRLGEVARNSFFTTNLLSKEFIAGAISSWYRMHNALPPPETIKHRGKTYFQFNKMNAFVNIINPNTIELGCSYARFNNGRSLICLYYPSLHSNGSINLRLRPKIYECPPNFPHFDKIFTSICIPLMP